MPLAGFGAAPQKNQKDKILRIYLILICLVLAVLSGVAQAQAASPAWMNADERQRLYPAQEWFTGLASGRLETGANAPDSRRAVENAAKSALAESILATVKGDWQSIDTLSQKTDGSGVSETFSTQTRQAVQITTKVTIPNLKTQLYEVPGKKEIYAFAAVKCVDLAVFLSEQIKMDLAKAETAMTIAKQQKSAGEKKRASERVEEAKQLLADINSYRTLLLSVNAAMNMAHESGLQTDRVNKLYSEIERLLTELNITVYMDCRHEFKNSKDDAFRTDPRIFCGIITQALSENACHLKSDLNDADYVLTLITSTTQARDGRGEFRVLAYYANVEASLYNRVTKKDVMSFSIREYGDGNSPELAATKAFRRKELKEEAMEKILSAIKN
jgi:hypothetical protein